MHQPVGIGLRAPYYEDVLTTRRPLNWVEIHPENYFGGGLGRKKLSDIRERKQLSFHGVGLSLGSDQPVDENHLARVKELIDLFDPFHVSDHASWSMSGNAHLNDLLPLPYTQETLDRLCCNIDQTQTYFGRQILVENPSTYVDFVQHDMREAQLMNALAEKTGCKILLDINNIYVQAINHGFDPWGYIDEITPHHVGEMHLAGHIEKETRTRPILVDTHNQPVRGRSGICSRTR